MAARAQDTPCAGPGCRCGCHTTPPACPCQAAPYLAPTRSLPAGIHEMDPLLCGSAVISHNEVSGTDHQRTARRTSPMQQELSTVAIDLASVVASVANYPHVL